MIDNVIATRKNDGNENTSAMASSNNSRRVFRGRAGPTDGRLPKHQARRRKEDATDQQQPASWTSKYSDNGNDDAAAHDDFGDGHGGDATTKTATLSQEAMTRIMMKANLRHQSTEGVENESNQCNTTDEGELEIIASSSPVATPVATPAAATATAPTNTPNTDSPATNDSTDDAAAAKEMKHLRKRIHNVIESIQLGNRSLANPSTWQANVLNAVENCVEEWKAIVRHYRFVFNDEATVVPITNAGIGANSDIETMTKRKETAVEVFVLVQLSMQCGPLKGSSPGYFKRCGGAVSRIALNYLDLVLPDNGVSIGFSAKQQDAVRNWKKAAFKAAEANKEPSKAAQKQQADAEKKQQSNQRVKEKKKAKAANRNKKK